MEQVLSLRDMEPSTVPSRTRLLHKEGIERANQLRRRGGACDECRRLKRGVLPPFFFPVELSG